MEKPLKNVRKDDRMKKATMNMEKELKFLLKLEMIFIWVSAINVFFNN